MPARPGHKHGAHRPYQPWHAWYKRVLWRTRREHQLKIEPLCRYCFQNGRVVPANVVDHVKPHGGDWALFARGELQSLCAPCHDKRKREIDLNGFSFACDENGNPLDPNHPSYIKPKLTPCKRCGSGWHSTDEHPWRDDD